MTPPPTKAELLAAASKTIDDVIARDLKVLFCGINPGLYSAATGWHFARPGNRFWRALHDSGFTPHRLQPSQHRELLRYSLGVTNLVPRATAAAAELSRQELQAGAEALRQKIDRYRPAWIAFVGIGAYRAAFGRSKAVLGPQPEKLHGSGIWVLPSTSGLNANHHPADFARLFRDLREAARPPLTVKDST